MKRMIYGLTMAVTVIFFSSCEKDNVTPLAGKKKPVVTGSEKAAPSVNVTTNYSCGARVCNAIEGTPSGRYNMLTMQKVTGPSSLTYSLYERTFNSGGIEVYTRYAQFSCSNTTTQYANGFLNNGAANLVCSTDVTNSPTLPGITQVYVNGVLQNPPADTDFDLVTLGNEEGASGCGPSDD
jgi:hypothetical protein